MFCSEVVFFPNVKTFIMCPIAHVQPASIDIPVGSVCYLIKEKVLPFGRSVRDLLSDNLMLEKKLIDSEEGVVLLKGQTYLIKCGVVELQGKHTTAMKNRKSVISM